MYELFLPRACELRYQIITSGEVWRDQHSNTSGVFSRSLFNIKVQIFLSETAATLTMFTSFGVLISAQNLGQQHCISQTSLGWYDLWGGNHSIPIKINIKFLDFQTEANKITLNRADQLTQSGAYLIQLTNK